MRFDLASARAAAAEDRTAIWVGDFLASRGSDNEVLAAALALKEHWWLGPTRVPLADLVRLAGPEDDALVPIDEQEWEVEIDDMAQSLEEGWEPPPLLAEYQDGRLLLQDGNHRYEALQREGAPDAWVLIFFEDPAARERFTGGRSTG
jgi:ParB-like nuclease domain